ncbi:hypothetical protein Poli38472_009045 [Pythium oligandrum]|uniref:vitamin-K-epoxide reductase (warfarin-sensitive) n=1 Tax=Pythium oligandrum TaxID=41045 RepID=A0A8K1CKZ4_PYTOL|nr:hypothetical protein Poli38472_009045 [Pythium oligandrum]|eukprot:TMW64878.1 hypothetical protein Poli38472_009045 [Pythium oligandrum]
MRVRRAGRQLVFLGVLGALVSAYGLYVEHQKHKHKDGYKALCDSEYFSCSKVMTSEYGSLLLYHGLVSKGSLFDVPNALLGIGAYGLFILYPVLRYLPFHQHFYVLASICSLAISAYLAYILAFVLRDFCLVCVSSYLINLGLFWNSLQLTRGPTHRRRHAHKSD